jgi:hypothetical protein
MKKNNALSILMIVAWLFIAFLMDRLYRFLVNYSTFHYQIINLHFAIVTMMELLFAGMAVFLFWFIFVKNTSSVLAGWTAIVLGLVAFLLASPFIILPLARMDSTPLIAQTKNISFLHNILIFLSGKMYFFSSQLVPLEYLAKAGALTLALGIAILLRKSPKVVSAQN